MEDKMTEKRKPGRPKLPTKLKGKRLRKYMTDDQLARFMKAIKQSIRDDFLFSLMLYVGARVVEIVNIELDDINEESNQIVIRGVKKAAHGSIRLMASSGGSIKDG